ncbi:MAG: hypothetical protein RI926_1449 [Actinomycetota bacterium]|jgi:hypothetical protein
MSNQTKQLGTLKTVDLRTIWKKEDRDFTPWLLDNSDRLAEALGIDIELHEAEHSVGTFSLDLLGKLPGTDEVIIVENQLEQSDHTHLGQIMTYAGGTDAKVVVWIAPRFREEHRSALDWLNENTVEGVRFFAVEISAVQIGDSVPAPLFNVVVKPNDWGKAIKASAQSNENSERYLAYRDFWEMYLNKLKQKLPNSTKTNADIYRSWIVLSSGTPKIYFATFFNRQGLNSFVETQDPDHEYFQILLENKGSFESSFGGELIWEEVENRKSCRIGVVMKDANILQEDSRTEQLSWLLDTQERLRTAFEAHRQLLETN